MGTNKLLTKTITMPNGKRKYIRAKTKAELNKKYAQLKAEIGAGVDISNNSTVQELAQMWYTVYKEPHLRQCGKESILNTVNNRILPYIGTMKVRDVKPVHIRQVMAEQSKYSKRYQSKVLQALKGMFLAAEENNIIVKTPVPHTLKAGGEDAKEKTPLTVEQSKRLLAATKGTRAYIPVVLMLSAGLRREEVCGLMWSDIDLDNGTVTVRRAKTFYDNKGELSDKTKTVSAKRTVPIPTVAVDALKSAKAEAKSVYVMSKKDGTPITLTSFRNIWAIVEARTTDDPKTLGKPVGKTHPDVVYELDFHVHPHLLRHTCITRWFDEGLDLKTVQYLAGHAKPEITIRIYDHYKASVRQQNTTKRIRESTVLAEAFG
jgi:integrase